MFYRIIVVFLIATINVSFCSYASAQPQISTVITLGDAVSAALESSTLMHIYPLKKEGLLGQAESADLNPAININIEFDNILGTGDLRLFDGAEGSLSLSSVIELGDKRSVRVSVVNRRIDLLEAEQKVTELDLISETAFRFIDVVTAQERLLLQQQAVDLAQQTISLIQPLVEAGQTPQLELTRANATLLLAQIAEEYAGASLQSDKLKLSTMWNSQIPGFDSASADFFNPGEAGTLTSILLNLDNNPNVAIYADEERLQNAQLREARAQSQTNIEWSAGVRHLKEINDTGLIFSVSVPLFNGKRSSGGVRSAQANLAEVDAKRQSSLNIMRGQLFSLHEQLKQAISETSLLKEEVLPLLNEVLQEIRAAYEGGRYGYLDLISAQQEYLDAELALINSAANAHIFITEIERLSGEPLIR